MQISKFRFVGGNSPIKGKMVSDGGELHLGDCTSSHGESDRLAPY